MLTLFCLILTGIFNGCVGHRIECPTIPCQNGATCQWNDCICPDGFRGEFCEYVDQDCPDVPCENGGTCDGNVCVCPDGYHGQFCGNFFINLGCFPHPHSVIQLEASDNMTLDMCAETCSELGYLYAYVFAVFCDCSDIFPLRPSEELPCDIPCPGDNETLCGSEANYEYDYFDYHYYYHYRDDSFIDSVLFTGNPVDNLCSLQEHWTGVVCPEVCTSTNPNVVDGFECTCFEGRSKNDTSGICEDIDECANNMDPCNPQAVLLSVNPTCENTEGSFRCLCPQGFSHNNETYNCDEIDECQDNRCSHGCEDSIAFFNCTCPEGHQLMANDLTCEDINECTDSDLNNCTAICLNQLGSFNCTCEGGFTLDGDGISCTDIDECITASPCDYMCNNTHGSFTCSCEESFVLNPDERTCRDVDECAEWVDGDICEYECINTHGNHLCFCQRGYQTHEYIVDACPEISVWGLLHATSQNGNYSILSMSEWCAGHVAYSQNNGLNYFYFNERGPYWLIGTLNCNGLQSSAAGVLGYANDTDPSHISEVWFELVPGNNPINNREVEVKCNDESKLFTISRCDDVDECDYLNGYCQHTCNNTLGSHICLCNDGYTLSDNGFSCIDVNECESESTHNCTQLCLNTDGGYSCSCMRGYKLDDADGRNCSDIDECQTNNGLCRQQCNNTEGGYVCDCEHGYKLDLDGRFCMDVDECSIGEHNCSNKCINYAGNYRCSCEEGYELVDQFQCDDVDECQTTPCEHNCTNTNGSFVCSCKAGYVLSYNGHGCVNIDECSRSEENNCSQICKDNDGSYACSCNSGYELDTDNKTCSDLNECSINNGGCQQNCTNIESGFSCSCSEGYSLGRDGSSCTDNNECRINGENMCDQVCVNIDGNYTCECYLGYESDGPYACTDVDECSTNTSLCEQICANTNGSYKCSCDAGYQLQRNLFGCSNIDECSRETANCRQRCIDTDGSYYCLCDPGYELDIDNTTCLDINECSINNGGCEQNCTNIDSGFLCGCSEGYSLGRDGSSCTDNNECSYDGVNMCEQVCVNIDGNYMCGCYPGFVPDGQYACTDVDECSTNISLCEQSCTNTNGSYKCSCDAGYKLLSNLIGCTNINECLRGSSNCEDVCTDTDGSFSCSCNPGYKLTSNGYSCEDIDECSSYNNGHCDQICNNSAGSYHCECNDGYTLHIDGRTCQNINECEYSSVCQHLCIENHGKYTCACRPGYAPDLTQNCTIGGCTGSYLCNDIDECNAQIKPPCEHICINTEGSYNCSCLPGFRLLNDEESCQDIDECLLGTARCSDHCTNNLGRYTCFCITTGTFLHPNLYNCIGPYYYTIQLPFNLQDYNMTALSDPRSADFESLSMQIEAYLASLNNPSDVNITNIIVNRYEIIAEATIQRRKRQVTPENSVMAVVTFDFSAALTDLQIGVVFNNIENEITNGGNSILINGQNVSVTGPLQYIDNTNGTLVEWDVLSVCHLYENKNKCPANSHCVEINGLPTCNCSLEFNLNGDGECVSDAFSLQYILIIVGVVVAIALGCSLAIIFQCIRTNFTDAPGNRSEYTDDSNRYIHSGKYYTNQIYGKRSRAYQPYTDMYGTT